MIYTDVLNRGPAGVRSPPEAEPDHRLRREGFQPSRVDAVGIPEKILAETPGRPEDVS